MRTRIKVINFLTCVYSRENIEKMDVDIKFVTSGVISIVHEKTAYVGAKMAGDPNAYARIATTEADEGILVNAMNEGCTLLYDALQRYDPVASVDESVVSVSLKMPNSYDTGVSSAVKDKLRQFFADYAVSAWFMATNKAEAEVYRSAAVGQLTGLRVLLAERKHPTRVKPVEVRRETTGYE